MVNFGDNLRTLRKREQVSQKDLAIHLGVAQNTIANYENNKRFPDQNNLLAIADYFNTTLDSLLGRGPLLSSKPAWGEAFYEELRKQLFDFILSGGEKEAIQIVLERADSNSNIFQLYEQVIRKTLVEIGWRWHQGYLSVSWEHYATGVMDKIILLLASQLKPEAANGYTAICMSYSSDPHTSGVKMISEYLQAKGYQSYYLGGNTTTDSLIEMIQQLKPQILAISVTLNYHIDGLKNMVDHIRNRCDCTKLKVIVGGQAFERSKDLWKYCGANGYATDFQSLQKIISVE